MELPLIPFMQKKNAAGDTIMGWCVYGMAFSVPNSREIFFSCCLYEEWRFHTPFPPPILPSYYSDPRSAFFNPKKATETKEHTPKNPRLYPTHVTSICEVIWINIPSEHWLLNHKKTMSQAWGRKDSVAC